MNSNLQVVATREFNGITLNCYQEKGQQDTSDFFATREQIGQLLEYENPEISIANIHNRNKERLDKFSTLIKLIRVEGARSVARDVTVYNFKGLLEICRYSQQPNAHNVIDVLWDIADEIRKTGSYSIKQRTQDDFDRELREHERIMKDLDLRGAQILQSLIDNNSFPVTPETRTVFAHEVFKLVTGHSYLGMLPECTEKWYTAGEIGEIVGLSANMVGRIAKANGLKAPDGEANEFGRWIFSKSKHSSREVPSFIYNDDALEWFKHYREG